LGWGKVKANGRRVSTIRASTRPSEAGMGRCSRKTTAASAALGYARRRRPSPEKTLAGNLSASPADEAAGPQRDPVMSAASGLLLLVTLQSLASAEALNDHGAQTEKHGKKAGIEPSQIHRRTSAPSSGFVPPCAHRTSRPRGNGNRHARHFRARPGRNATPEAARNLSAMLTKLRNLYKKNHEFQILLSATRYIRSGPRRSDTTHQTRQVLHRLSVKLSASSAKRYRRPGRGYAGGGVQRSYNIPGGMMGAVRRRAIYRS